MAVIPDGGNWQKTVPTGYSSNLGGSSGIPGVYEASGAAGGYANAYQQWVNGAMSGLQNQYLGNVGLAGQIRNNAQQAAQGSYGNDLARLGEQRYRDVDLARLAQGNQDNYNYNQYWNNRGVAEADMSATQGQWNLDQGNYDRLYNNLGRDGRLRQDEYNTNRDFIQGQLGNLGKLADFLNQQYGISLADAKEQLRLGTEAAGLTRGIGERAIVSRQASSGAIGSAGARQGNTDLLNQYNNTVGGLNNSYNTGVQNLYLDLQRGQNDLGQQGNALNNQLMNAWYGYAGDINNINDQIGNLGYQRNSGQIQFDQNMAHHNANLANLDNDYQYQQGQSDVTSKTIDSIAREYGIREGDVNNALRTSLTNAGLDYNATIQQLSQQLQSGQSSLQQQAQNFLASLLAM